jgi:hypothetical protein
METITYPHLTNQGGTWIVVDLEKWTPIKNKYIPLMYRKLQELDYRIRDKLGPEYGAVKAYRDQHLTTTTKSIFSIRSPYMPDPNLPDTFHVSLPRALLSIFMGFSYHNWYKCLPLGTTLGRVCDLPQCKNPFHYAMGMRRSRATALIFDSKPDLEDIERPVPEEFEEWAALEDSMLNMIQEAKDLGDSEDKIISEVGSWAKGSFGDRPPPHGSGYRSIEEFIRERLRPRRVTTGDLRTKTPTITEEEVKNMIKRKGD